MPGIQDHIKIAVDVAAEALEVADLMEDGSWDDEDVFDCHGSNGIDGSNGSNGSNGIYGSGEVIRFLTAVAMSGSS